MKSSRIRRTDYKKNAEINKKKGYFAIVGCLMVDIAVGEFNLLSHLYPYIASYFRMKNPKIDQDNMNFIPMVWLLSMSLTSPIGIALFKKLGYRGSFTLFLSIFGFSQFISSFIEDYWIFIWVYSICGGIAQGGCIILPLYCGWRYFPASYKAKISGILLSAYALAPIPSSFVALYIINPHNKDADDDGYFPDDVAENVPDFFRVFAVGSFVFGMIGVFLITEPLPVSQKEEERLKMKKLMKGKKKKKSKKKKKRKGKNADLEENFIEGKQKEHFVKTVEIEEGLHIELDEGQVPQDPYRISTKEKIIQKARTMKEKFVEKIENLKTNKSDIFEAENKERESEVARKKKAKFGIGRFSQSKKSESKQSRASSSKNSNKSGENTTNKLAERVEMIKTKIQPFHKKDLLIFKDKVFLNCYLILLIEYIFPHFGLFSFKKIGLENDRSDRFITLTGIVGSLFNAGSRLIIGLTYEKFGYAVSAYSIMFIEVTSSLIFYPAAKSDWSFMVSICWFYNTYGAQLGLYPLVTDTLFKSKGAFSYSILFSAFSLSSVVILFSMEIVQKWVSGYNNLMYVLCVVAVLPIYNIWILNKRIKEVSDGNKEVNEELKAIVEEEEFGTDEGDQAPAPVYVEEDDEALV